MTTETITETEPALDVGACWPPVAHLVHKDNLPAKEGDRALCGAKLMGIDLGRLLGATRKPCEKCLEIFKRDNGL